MSVYWRWPQFYEKKLFIQFNNHLIFYGRLSFKSNGDTQMLNLFTAPREKFNSVKINIFL